ncbi:hypothetical protein QQM39_32910 [Streptomyces sp. DT2A-34]|uniref:hypothetical protein n=1 Tax=Streptomyces sp. DT2A-34 TaxID=3051182 RepID=UPI00265B72BA|nr:hypothetical protein [Streptomyces sp. DT2A-34]MDO0915447.1 hypothetical protein [Streptomyces sp. DT2A-34]
MWWTGWGLVAFPVVVFPTGIGGAWGAAGEAVGMIVGGVLLWFIGTYMNRDVLYIETNEYLPRNRHTLYSIPIQYLSVLVILWAIGSLLFGSENFPT